MKKYKIVLKNASSLLMNRLGKDILDEVSKIKKDEITAWEEENWQKKLYTDKDNNIIFPCTVIHAMLVEAGKKHPERCPKDVGRTWTNYLKSCMLIENDSVIKCTEPQPFGTMVNGNPSSGKGSSKVYKIRPLINEWEVELMVVDLVGKTTAEHIEGLFGTGGKFVGLCDWRPQYGRFYVNSVKEVGE